MEDGTPGEVRATWDRDEKSRLNQKEKARAEGGGRVLGGVMRRVEARNVKHVRGGEKEM